MYTVYDVEYFVCVNGGTDVYFLNGKKLYSPRRVTQILNDCCQFHGSTLMGRRQAICQLLRIRQKAPVLVNLFLNSIFFPTKGIRQIDNYWINYGQIKKLVRSDPPIIEFYSGHRLTLDVSYRMLRQQLNRCSQYLDQIVQVMTSEVFINTIKG